jgi:hypothetical protein
MTVEDMEKWRKILRDVEEEEAKEVIYDESMTKDLDPGEWRDLAIELTCALHNCFWAAEILWGHGKKLDLDKKTDALECWMDALRVLERANKIIPCVEEGFRKDWRDDDETQ